MIRPDSQNARLLEVLRRGPATNADIHREAGHMIVNSRVSELVKKHGYEIRCEHLGGTGATAYRYTLLSEPEPVGDQAVTGSAVALLVGDPVRASASESSDSSGEGAVSHVAEEGPRSPTPLTGAPDAQEPRLRAPSLAPTPLQLTFEDVAA